MDVYKTLILSSPQVVSSTGAGLLASANNLSDVADVSTARTNLGVYSSAQSLSGDSSRRVAGYVQSDGATTNRAAGIYGPFDATTQRRGWLANSAALTLIVRLTVPTASSSAEIWGAASSSTALASATAWGIGLAFSTNDLVLRMNGATPASDFRTVTWTGFRTTYSGQEVFLRVAIANGTSTPTLTVNGSLLAGTAADGAGTDPDWLSSSLDSTWHKVGYNWAATVTPVVIPVLGTLTDTESEAFRLRGMLPVWVQRGGSASILHTSNFSAGTDSWAAGSGCSIAGNVDGIDGEDDWLSLQRTGTTGQVGLSRAITGMPAAVLDGAWYQTRFRIYNASATTRYFSIGFAGFAATGFQSVAIPATTKVDVLVAYKATLAQAGNWGNDFRIQSVTSTGAPDSTVPTGDIFYFKNIAVNAPGGALTVPFVQQALVLDDSTQIGDNQGRLLGCIPVSDEQRWRLVARTNTNGNQQLFAGSVFMDANRSRIDSWVIQNNGSSRTVSLGNASAGTAYANGITVAAGLNDVTLATRFPATINLWANSNGTDVLTHTIEGHRVGTAP